MDVGTSRDARVIRPVKTSSCLLFQHREPDADQLVPVLPNKIRSVVIHVRRMKDCSSGEISHCLQATYITSTGCVPRDPILLQLAPPPCSRIGQGRDCNNQHEASQHQENMASSKLCVLRSSVKSSKRVASVEPQCIAPTAEKTPCRYLISDP